MEDTKHLHITLSKKSVSEFGKNLSKKEFETLSEQLSKFLASEGYTYEFSYLS